MHIPDHILNEYTNQLWGKYDIDNSGTLEPNQMHWIFNDLFVRLGDPRLFTPAEILTLFKMADKNHDGHVDKTQFFNLCKYELSIRPSIKIIKLYVPPPADYQYGYLLQKSSGKQVIVIRR